MKKFSNFILSKSAPVFAVLMMSITLFTLYSKMYYIGIPAIYRFGGGYGFVDMILAGLFGLGLAVATLIVIAHSKNRGMPQVFAIGDFIGSLLFYANGFSALIDAGGYIVIAQGIFFALIKALVLFYCAEIFVNYHKEQIQEVAHSEELTEALQASQATAKSLAQQLDQVKAESEAEKQAMFQKLSQTKQGQATEVKNLTEQVQNLDSQIKNLTRTNQALKTELSQFKEIALNKRLSDLKKGKLEGKRLMEYNNIIEELGHISNHQ